MMCFLRKFYLFIIVLHILEDGDTREQNWQSRKLMLLNLGLGHIEKSIYQELYDIQYRRSKMLNFVRNVILLCVHENEIYLLFM